MKSPLAKGRKDSLANFVEPLWGQTPLARGRAGEPLPEQSTRSVGRSPEYYSSGSLINTIFHFLHAQNEL